MNRRQLLKSGAALAAALPVTGVRASAAWPSKPIKLIVPFPPGGGVDVQARIIAEPLAARLGQSVLVDYRSGAGGNIGANTLAGSDPDGYTLMISAPGPLSTNKYLYADTRYDPLVDFTPITLVAETPAVLVVNPKVADVRDIFEFLKIAKEAKPEMTNPIQGFGGVMHLSSLLLTDMTGIRFNYVSYRGGAPAIQDLLGGVFPFMFNELPSMLPHIQSGRVRALAVTTDKPSPSLPGVPTMKSAVPGFQASVWYAVVGPKDLPDGIILRLRRALDEVLAEPEVRSRIEGRGAMAVGGNPREKMELESRRWGALIKKFDLGKQ